MRGQCPMKNLEFLHVIYILSKNLRLQSLKDSVSTAYYSVQLRLINTRFVSYNDRALLFSRLPNMMHASYSPSPFPSVFAYCKRSKTGGGNSLGTRLGV